MQIHRKKIEELGLDTLVTTFANKHPRRILPCLSNMHVRTQLQIYMCIENDECHNYSVCMSMLQLKPFSPDRLHQNQSYRQ